MTEEGVRKCSDSKEKCMLTAPLIRFSVSNKKSPDNQATGNEWCYVDADQGLGQNNQNWGFCKEILDYDKVRMKCKDILYELIIKTRQTSSAISAQIGPTGKTISEIE